MTTDSSIRSEAEKNIMAAYEVMDRMNRHGDGILRQLEQHYGGSFPRARWRKVSQSDTADWMYRIAGRCLYPTLLDRKASKGEHDLNIPFLLFSYRNAKGKPLVSWGRVRSVQVEKAYAGYALLWYAEQAVRILGDLQQTTILWPKVLEARVEFSSRDLVQVLSEEEVASLFADLDKAFLPSLEQHCEVAGG